MQSLLLSLLPSVLALLLSHVPGRHEALGSPLGVPRPLPGSKVVIVVGRGTNGNDGAVPGPPPTMVTGESQINEANILRLRPSSSLDQIKHQGQLGKRRSSLLSQLSESKKEKSFMQKFIPSSPRHISGVPSDIFHHRKDPISNDKNAGFDAQIVDFRPHQPDITSDMRNNNGKLSLPILGFADDSNGLGVGGLATPSPTPMANKLNPYTNGVAASFPPGIDPYEGFIRYAAENLETPMGNIVDYHSLEHYYGPQHPLSPYHSSKEVQYLRNNPYADSFAYGGRDNGIETGNSPPPPPPPPPPESSRPRPPHQGFGGDGSLNINDRDHHHIPHHVGRGGEGDDHASHYGGSDGEYLNNYRGGVAGGHPPPFGRGDVDHSSHHDGKGSGFRSRDNPMGGRGIGSRGSNYNKVNTPPSYEHGIDHFHAPSPGLGAAPPRPRPYTADPALYEDQHGHRSPPFEHQPHGVPPHTLNHHALPFKHGISVAAGGANSLLDYEGRRLNGSRPPPNHNHLPDPPDLDVFEEGPPPPGLHLPLPPPHRLTQNNPDQTTPQNGAESNDGGEDSIWGILDLADMLEKGQLSGQGNANTASDALQGGGKPQTSIGSERIVVPVLRRPHALRSYSSNTPDEDGPPTDNDANQPDFPPRPPSSLHSNSPNTGLGQRANGGDFDYDDQPGGGTNAGPAVYGGQDSHEGNANDYGDDL